MAEELEFFTQNVRFRVDGKQYVGCMDIDALGELQKIWGIATLAEMQKRVENVGLADMKDIVFASLLREHPKLTRDQANKIANAMGMSGVVKYVTDVMRAGTAPRSAVLQPGPTRRVRTRKKP